MKKLFFLISFLFAALLTTCFAGDKAHHKVYFDASTGHKYIKIDVNTYAEYSKRGKYLKNVPSDLPLLIHRSNILHITDESYILYEKTSNGSLNQKLIKGHNSHPEGWNAKKLLVSLN